MKSQHTFSSLIILPILIINTLVIHPLWATSGSENLDIRDSLILLKNILKDIQKEKEIEDRYKLFIRAESLYKGISKSLSGNETSDLKKKLIMAFKGLPPPGEVSNSHDLQFRLIAGGKSPFYWSSPVRESIFAEFLNDFNKTKEYLNHNLNSKFHKIFYNSRISKMQSNAPNAPLASANFIAAKEFANWLTKADKVTFALPNLQMVETIGDKEFSGWTKTTWKSKDEFLGDAWEMFGGEFFTLILKGEAIGELPEACYPQVRIRLVASISTGKKLFIKKLKSKL